MKRKQKTTQSAENLCVVKWKICKLGESLLDTVKGLNRRQILAISAHNKLKYILESKKN